MIRVYTREEDYGNELHILVVDERPGLRAAARVENGQFVFTVYQEGESPPPTLILHRGVVEEFFSGLEDYRGRNQTTEDVLRDALTDTRATRDRLLDLVEGRP